MRKIGFSNEKYIELQSKHIKERIKQFDNKLYLEFGGKLFDDHHASRVLPGFEPDSKLKMLLELKQDAEIIIVINANDIENNKMRGDLGITYDLEVLRLIDAFNDFGLTVGSVCITHYKSLPQVDSYIEKLNHLGIVTYKHYEIEGYPHDINKIISEDGFGKNEYIKTNHPVVVITAPGPGSGKMATCLSQLYHENKNGIKAGYSKYETFPIWNLPLNHPTNIAYEAATIDLNDINMIDPYHLEAYNKLTVNYNRDVEIFPVLRSMFQAIYGNCPYKSPTDMGVNMAGFAIVDNDVVERASKDEIIRRYLNARVDYKNGKINLETLEKASGLLQKVGVSVSDRKCVAMALEKKEKTNADAMAMELEDGTIITAKTSSLLLAPSALILNALKHYAHISDELPLLPRMIIEPITKLKTEILGNHNPKLHVNEVLNALAISAQTNPLAELVIKELPKLKNAQAHSTIILSEVDMNALKKLKIDVTCEPEHYAHRFYSK